MTTPFSNHRVMPARKGGPYTGPYRVVSNAYNKRMSEQLKRSVQIQVHVTADEYAAIEKYCCRNGVSKRMSRSSVVREWILEGLAREIQS